MQGALKIFLRGRAVVREMSHFSTARSSEVIVEKLGQITTIGLNRPSKRNCIDLDTAKRLSEEIQNFEQDDDASVAVFHGTGGNFCSGYDLNELANSEVIEKEKIENGLLGLPWHIRKPTVAAVNGYAVAGGFELALLCDLRVMEDTAVMGLYGRRFGIPLTDGATVRLQSMIGLSRALDLILTGRSLSAKEAFEWGVVNRIVACGTGLGQAINLASSLVKFPQECILTDRESTYNAAFNKAYEELLQKERINAKQLFQKKSIVDGAKKFLSGLGRHGKTYNLAPKDICEWEKEFVNTKPKSKL
ncbi:unnamed protein product [Acanthoscelides obtectus]|uniref:Enoyl-CoA hydratase n=1 Tax=Acanthoscelides obtectus TaxID=200917 RepID=A0A9P0Q7S4_ACAOB|nr:unnamed protein product [Acanthoscelides obtectus]CAK1631677.1 Carnitinyl-CoA dehydratase [Acanthoscelides obtectus]